MEVDFVDRTSDDLRVFLNLRRFTSLGYSAPERVNGDLVPLDSENVPELSGATVYSVIWLGRLPELIHPDDRDELRKHVDLPGDGLPDDPTKFIEQMNSLSDVERQFHLADGKCIGRPIVWFTTQESYENMTRQSGVTGRGIADTFCDLLGLAHHPAGTWLILLEIPGVAVQNAGHYRPAFCDSILLPSWFMARSSWPVGSSAHGPWGQTANLDALAAGHGSCDGAPERVARQLFRSDFDGLPLRFHLLGQVMNPNGTESAFSALSATIWSRRR
jgi:hypothetical protein